MSKNIYFFWDKPETMPSAYKSNIDIARSVHPDYSVKLCSLQYAEETIRGFDSELMQIFSAVVPPACKSDIFRLVMLYLNGGWYLDCDLRLIRRLDYIESEGMNTVFVRDDSRVPSITNMALFFQKESPVLLKMIELVKSYYRYGLYNHDVWSFSGPGVFNVFYNDETLSKKSFVEFFKSAKNSTFASISTSTSTSWKYQQCFGVYKAAFNPVKFRSSAELLRGISYALSLGKGNTLDAMIKANAENLNIPFQEEYIPFLSLTSFLLMFKESTKASNKDKLLRQIIIKSEVKNLNVADLKPGFSAQDLRHMAIASKEESMTKSAFLMFFAAILKPEGPMIQAEFKAYKNAPELKAIFVQWGA